MSGDFSVGKPVAKVGVYAAVALPDGTLGVASISKPTLIRYDPKAGSRTSSRPPPPCAR